MVKTYVGQKIIHLASVDSTNNYTAKLLKEGQITSGAVILSDIQTEGRGQRAKLWQSLPYENLTFSFLIQPDALRNITTITINHCVSLALAQFIRTQGYEAQLKWPNDIYVDHKKIAGILIENSFSSGRITNSIIGIGMNINQRTFDSINATSLSLLTGNQYAVKSVLFDIIYQLNKQFEHFEATSTEKIKTEYDQQLWKINSDINFSVNGHPKKGVLLGTNQEGNLLVKMGDDIVTFRNGEIVFDLTQE